jgi:hypothetical protein
MAGVVEAGSAQGGGAVEITSSKQVARAGLDRITLGPGGTLMLDTNNIHVASANPGDDGYSYLLDKEVTSFLGSGAKLILQARDKFWWENNAESNKVAPAAGRAAGDLMIEAGNTATLSGVYNGGGGNWSIYADNYWANEPGKVHLDVGAAALELGTGTLDLFLYDRKGGGGSAGMDVGSVNAAQLSAGIVRTSFYTESAIRLTRDIAVSGAVSLSGDLRVKGDTQSPIRIKGQSVTWTDERYIMPGGKTGSTISGQGSIEFIENGVRTRLGVFGGNGDAVRLGLGADIAPTRSYGDADLTLADTGLSGLRVLDYSPSTTVDPRDTILAPGSLALTGPGQNARTGQYSMSLAATNNVRLGSGTTYGSYWIDLSPAQIPLTIKPREVDVEVLAGSALTTYGTAVPLVRLSNVVNGDPIFPVATTAGAQGWVDMSAIDGAFGFPARHPAGTYAYTIAGLGGDQYANYVLRPGSTLDGKLQIDPKPLYASLTGGMKTYGTLFDKPLATFDGALPGDEVRLALTFSKDGVAAQDSVRLPAGTYDLAIGGLEGSAAGNYRFTMIGPSQGNAYVAPALLKLEAKNATTTYGDTPVLGSTSPLVPGDQVDVTFGVSANGVSFSPSAKTPAGWYTTAITGISGPDAANYVADQAAGNGSWQVLPRTLNYQGATISQTYGQPNLPGPALLGVVGGDDVHGANVWTKPDGTPGSTNGIFNVGTYRVAPAELTGRDAGNYVLGTGSANTVQVTPKPVSVRVDPINTVYGTLPQLFPTVEGLIRNDSVTAAVDIRSGPANALTAILPAASYSLGLQAFLSGPAAGNYMLAPDSASFSVPFTVQPKPLFWNVSGVTTVTYGDAIGATASLVGVLPGDQVGALAGVLDSQGKAVVRPGAGAHLLSATALNGADAGNYTLTTGLDGNHPGNLTVNPRPITVNAIGSTTSVYGNTPAFGSVQYTNVLQGEDPGLVVGDLSQNNGVLNAHTPVGTYTASVVKVANPNYVLAAQAPVTGTVTITPRPVRYSTTDTSIVYGDLLPSGGATLLDDVVAGDDLHIAAVLPQGAAGTGRLQAGQYPLLGSLLGRSASNYELAATGSHVGQLTVAKRPLDISVDLFANQGNGLSSDFTASQRLYQLEYGYAQTLTPRLAMFNLIAGDSVSGGFTGSPLQFSTAGNLAAGTYQWKVIDLQGAALPNYDVRVRDTVLNVQRAKLYVTPGALRPDRSLAGSAEYGSTLGLFGGAASMENLKGNAGKQDQVFAEFDFAGASGTFHSLEARSPAGTYALVNGSLHGNDAANYDFVPRAGSFVVVPKLVTIQAPDYRTMYGEAVPADLVATISGALPGDRLGASYRLEDRRPWETRLDAGIYKFYPTGLTGEDAANYRFVDIESPLKASVPNLPATSYGNLYIDKRYLRPSTDTSALGFIYGGHAPAIVTDKPLSGDVVIVNPLAQPIDKSGQPAGTAIDTSGYLDAGSYIYTATLSGPAARNYTLVRERLGPVNDGPVVPLNLGTIDVAKRELTTTLDDRSTVYGNYAAPTGVVHNLVPGQQVGMVVTATDANGGVVDYTERTNAGKYSTTVTGLSGDAARNYTLAGSNTAKLDITPRELGWVAVDAPTAVYGEPVTLGGLRGLLFNDDVSVKGSVGGPSGPLGLANGVGGATRFEGRLDVGTYDYSFAGTDNLMGAKSGNYYLPKSASGKFSFTTREVVYAVDNAQGSYGNYKACERNCDPWVPGIDLGKVHFQTVIDGRRVEGIAAGDDLGGTLGLLDFNGVSGTLDSKTPVGTYFEVVTGLTGKSASNYRIAPTGSAPGILTITPMWLSYVVSNAVYVQGIGLVGKPGIATLRGPNGTPINGDDVSGLVGISGGITSLENISPGRHAFGVTGLTGKDAANYRLIKVDSVYWMRDDSKVGNAGPYGRSDIGTLDVYAGSNLGLGLIGNTDLPVVPKTAIPPPVYYQPVTMPELDGFGRNITVTGTAVKAGPTGAGAAASGTVDGNTSLGNAELSANASGATQALAQVGIKGISLAASAGGHTDVMMTIGDGYVTYGLQGDAAATAKLGKDGLALSAEAIAQMRVKGGASGSLGAAGDGEVSATTATFVYAKAENEYGLKDGKIVAKSENSFGVGASAGATGEISGSVGSVSAGATVYTPGSFGGKIGADVGYEDGKISVALDLGGTFGVGGLDFSIGFSINVGGAWDSIVGKHKNALDRLEESWRMGGDPVARFAYLNEHPEWRHANAYFNDAAHADGYDKTVAFFNQYSDLLNGIQKLVAEEKAEQTKFMDLLKKDPAAAVQYSHNNGAFANQQAKEWQLAQKAQALGVRLVVNDGALIIANR